MNFSSPDIDYARISPIIALTVGIVVVLMVAVTGRRTSRAAVSIAAMAALGAAAGLLIWQFDTDKTLVAGALRLDGLAVTISLLCVGSGMFAVLLALREPAAFEDGLSRHGELHALLLTSVLGMVLLAWAQNLVALFVALELLSIPLYVMCGFARDRAESLESGLKYLIVGSLGSATVLYGSAFIYGGSGSTDFGTIAAGIGDGLARDPLILMGVALLVVGMAFKVSVAPFHQWTPDVYQGAPTTVTAFMAVATKAAAFAVFVRLFEVALAPTVDDWRPALAVLAAISMAVGNIGALRQSSLKRILGWSGVAQGGYMLVGVACASAIGVRALVFYLAAYALMNLAAFAVIAIRERESEYGDDIRSVEGLGADRPLLAGALTVAMLALAGLPGTAGFIGKLYLIEAAVDADYTWLGVAIAIGTMISLAYYLRVIAAVWMTPRPGDETPGRASAGPAPMPAIAGASPEADPMPSGGRCALLIGAIALVAGATIFFGIIPSPLVDFAEGGGDVIELKR